MSISNAELTNILPNFLGIGTQRGATTWIFNCLKEHPEVFVPEAKEVSFFDHYFDKGIKYYASFFEGARGFKAIGEITPDYLYCLECPERIARFLPRIKMIVILRNPIDRAFSAYHFFYHRYSHLSFEEAIEYEPSILKKGLYYEQIKRYFEFFDRDAFLFMRYEDLVEDNEAAAQNIFKFIGVDSKFRPSWLGKTCNIKITPGVVRFLNKIHFSWLLEGFKRSCAGSVARKYLREKRKRNAIHTIDADTRRRLVNYYYQSNTDLEILLKVSFSEWNQ